MFDKIGEIFSTIKERLTSPLFSSFLISWVIINWRIVIGLFWLNTEQLHAAQYKTYLDVVSSNINLQRNLLEPFGVALFYTFAYPFVRNWINGFMSWMDKWGDDWNLDIKKDGSIPTARYIQLKNNYEEATKQVRAVIEDESKSVNQIDILQTELTNTKIALNQKSRDLSESYKRYNNGLLNGTWQNKYQIRDSVTGVPKQGEETVVFDNGSYDLVADNNQRRAIAAITNFQYDPNTNRVFFIKEFYPEYVRESRVPKELVCRLIISATMETMTGTESDNVTLTYKKVKAIE
jgi:hypothetical protein